MIALEEKITTLPTLFVEKRDGRRVVFDVDKIDKALHKAADKVMDVTPLEMCIRDRGYRPQILFGALKRKDYQGMLAYLTEKLPQVELKVTGFDYQGSLDETDVTGYDIVPSYREFISNFEARADLSLIHI